MVSAVVLAPAPGAEGVLARLAGVLSVEQRADLQAALVRRAAAWAREVAGERAVVTVEEGTRGERIIEAIEDAFDRWGGPVLVAGTDVPRLSAAHAAAALADLEAGGDASFGPSMDGGWYLAALANPRAELFDLAAEVWDGPVVMARTLEVAQRLQLEIGLLRMERALRSPGDLAAMVADPLSPSDVFGTLPTGIRIAQRELGRRSPGTPASDR